MSFALQPVADPAAPLARRNPVAKLAACALFGIALLATVDPVTPALALVIELAVAPFFGLSPGRLARRGWPLLIGAAGTLVSMLLFAGERTGTVLLSAGPIMVTSGTVAAGLALALRVLAVALPGVLVFATTDPTDLADALVQNARLPARFALGALAAFRLLPLLRDEWVMLTLARRARGSTPDATRSPSPGCSPRSRSRCWSARSGGVPGSPPRWTRAVSPRVFPARTPGSSVSGRPTRP
jgi:energy-coupling factor transport system permease protein